MIANLTSCMKSMKISECSTLWSEIFTRANNISPFNSYEWFTALCSNILNDDPEIMICWDKDQPIGIIPAFIKKNKFTFLTDERVTDLTGIITLPGHEYQTTEKLASFIIENDLELDISPLEPEGLLCKLLPTFIDDIKIVQADICPILTLADSWEGYLNSLSTKSRHELRRKMRKASSFEMRIVDRSEIDIFFKLMAASDASKEKFLNDRICNFLVMLADLFAAKQWLRMRALYSNETPVAALYAFQMNSHIYLYNSGFDPAFHQSSPGIAAISQDIRAAIDEGMQYYDFLRGNEEYKFRFGAQTRSTVRLTR